jgi:hypothetical protein
VVAVESGRLSRGGLFVNESSLGRLVAASELPVSRRKKELE